MRAGALRMVKEEEKLVVFDFSPLKSPSENSIGIIIENKANV